VVSAAANLAHRVVYGGMADLRPTPRELVVEGTLREIYHYPPQASAGAGVAAPLGDPVLLVSPLAAPALCYDLRRGCSLVEHLVEAGFPTYLVEYGAVGFDDRDLTIEPWVDEIVPAAIREVSARTGGRAVHLVGWSLGGTFALLAAATDPALPVASIAVLGSPFDVRQVPMVAPPRPLVDFPEAGPMVTQAYQAVAAQPLVQWARGLSSFQRLLTRPLAVALHLDDADYLAQLEAVDRLRARTTAYRGRTFGQLYHRLLTGNVLAEGGFAVGGRTVSLAAVGVPVLVLAGARDAIAPTTAVKAVVPMLTGAQDVRFEIVPGGHLGMLTGREARTGTWPVLDGWLEEQRSAGVAVTRRRTTRKRAATTRSRSSRTGVRPPEQQAEQPSEQPSDQPSEPPAQLQDIGTNPRRRHGSAGSRSLRP
jgi:polyhydroxyalkanoate synthase